MKNENQDPAVEFIREHLPNPGFILSLWALLPVVDQEVVWSVVSQIDGVPTQMITLGFALGTSDAIKSSGAVPDDELLTE